MLSQLSAEPPSAADGKLGAHGRAAVHHARERHTGDAEPHGELGHRQAAVLAQHGVGEHFAGMRRIVHTGHRLLLQ